ncbi:LolA family protein [Actinosynnema sp.]|uniref:LolA family protein n=1 Tax=Actinosynnema sp. TaxID=1872144 RepID=UPI003F8725BA
MNRRRTTVAVAAAGVAAGVVGLGVLAMPAGAGPAPVLPEVGAQELVESVLTAKPAAFGGSIQVDNNLGIPVLAGAPQLSDGESKARMWTDGQGRTRVQLPSGNSERTLVNDGSTLWMWNSADQKVVKHSADERPAERKVADPVSAAREVVTAVQQYSDVSVDGTARVANRSAYELVLAPKPDERTVLREVRVAVDSELRVPLRVSVLTNGTAEPAAQIGFTDFEAGAQDASLFSFTPPANAEVVEGKAKDEGAKRGPDSEQAEKLAQESGLKTVGEGWDAVLVAKASPDVLGQLGQARDGRFGKRVDGVEGRSDSRPPWARGSEDSTGSGSEGSADQDRRGQGLDPQKLLSQLGKKVSGDWGSGTLISTRVGSALIADDGRVALGAVPEQVLVEAIGQVK